MVISVLNHTGNEAVYKIDTCVYVSLTAKHQTVAILISHNTNDNCMYLLNTANSKAELEVNTTNHITSFGALINAGASTQ